MHSLLFFWSPLLGSLAWAQGSTSRIEGRVADVTGAVVPNASVRAINEDTGVSYVTKTGSTGTVANVVF